MKRNTIILLTILPIITFGQETAFFTHDPWVEPISARGTFAFYDTSCYFLPKVAPNKKIIQLDSVVKRIYKYKLHASDTCSNGSLIIDNYDPWSDTSISLSDPKLDSIEVTSNCGVFHGTWAQWDSLKKQTSTVEKIDTAYEIAGRKYYILNKNNKLRNEIKLSKRQKTNLYYVGPNTLFFNTNYRRKHKQELPLFFRFY